MNEAMELHYESVRQCLGREETVLLGIVTRQHMQRFAYACGDLNPLYFDEEVARAAGHDSLLAPPVFLTGILSWETGPEERVLRPDGLSDSDIAFLQLPGARLMGGGQDLEFDTPLQDGDEVSVQRKVTDVQKRSSRSGDIVLLSLEKRFSNQRGETLVICRETMIVR